MDQESDVYQSPGFFSLPAIGVQVRKAREAVMAANDAAIEMRRAAKQKELEEVESILAYQAMKVSK